MFASKTPHDLNHDPQPFACTAPDFDRYANPGEYEGRHSVVFDPRPEFDHVQHNEPNPILVEFREIAGENFSYRDDLVWWAQCLGGNPEIWASDGYNWTPEQIDHARRVLSRLATLTEGASA